MKVTSKWLKLKKSYWFQICPFSKTNAFSKEGPKNQQILKNSKNFFAFLVAIL
jgi:hypothetical protein